MSESCVTLTARSSLWLSRSITICSMQYYFLLSFTGGLMTYQEFKQYIMQHVARELGSSATISIQDIVKNNNTHLDGLTVFRPGQNLSPTVYLNYYFNQYQKGQPLSDVLSSILAIYQETPSVSSIDISFFTSYEKVRERIVFKLINYEKNRELLSDVPHFRYLDLAIVFNCLIRTDQTGTATILIRHQHLSLWNITDDDLYALAISNTPKLLPYDLRNMSEVLLELLGTDTPLPDELQENEFPMYMLSNRARLNGSGCILYQDLLQSFAEHLASDFYILPSSIHEVLLIPASDNSSPEELNAMVREVNASQLTREEVLSDHVYFYSREQKRLSM